MLQAIDLLGSRELAAIEERLAARKQINGSSPESLADVFAISFDEYMALPQEEREAIQLRADRTLQTWIDEQLQRHKARWMLVSGGEILETSSTMRNYPSREKLTQIGRQRGRIPFVFIADPLIEESAWSVLPDNDFYPAVHLTVAAPGTSAEQLPIQGLKINADFDTGSPDL
jgi:hypothetical protein